MKSIARSLRRLAERIDPQPSSTIVVRLNCDTSAIEEKLALARKHVVELKQELVALGSEPCKNETVVWTVPL